MAGTTADATGQELRHTKLQARHKERGAKMVPFAGYNMPVQYPLGVLKEHNWTREKAGLFDVSHMGIAYLRAHDGKHETAATALESLVPADILNLKPGRQRYTQLTNDEGGIIDDLMVARSAAILNIPAGCTSWSTPPEKTSTTPTWVNVSRTTLN